MSKDLVRFVHGFPIDSIPYQSENEKKIEKYKKTITKIKIEKLHLQKEMDADQKGKDFSSRQEKLVKQEEYWHKHLKQAFDMHKMEKQSNLISQKRE